MSIYVDQLASAVRATRIVANDVFWFGRRLTRPLPARFARVVTGAARDCRITALQDRLYADFYCPGRAVPAEHRPARAPGARHAPRLLAELSEANAGTGYIDAGWEIRRVDGAAVTVARDGIELLARRHECEGVPGATPLAGSRVGLRNPKELTRRLPGFYVACGDHPLSGAADGRLLRVYWNLTPRGSVELMRLATSLFNNEGVAFELKVLADLEDTSRADSAVLYFPRATYSQAIALVERLCAAVAAYLRPAVPTLTKALAPGVGLAEDPGGGVSFGQHRCRLLAAALLDADKDRDQSPATRLDRVKEYLASNGVSVEHPYLNAGSDDIYASSLAVAWHTPPSAVLATPQRDAAPDQWLATAERIATCICRDAAWSDGRCNWLGAGMTSDSAVSYGSLGAQLYGGTSGVALFLAEVASVTGNPEVRRTALGALRHALTRADGIDPEERQGLYAGWTGIALAAARVGLLTGDRSMLSDASELLCRIEPPRSARGSSDVISGAAGAIIGMLACRSLVGVRALSAAIELGDALLASATRASHGWSWRSPNRSGDMNLTGFSHGAAGIAWALLELYRACGDSRYRAAAEMAFAYERRWFDTRLRNWRDLRGYPARGTRRDDPVPCSAYWCHGAPGIALSRLRAFQITGDGAHRAEAVAALETTAALTERALDGRMNFSLCHGLAGNADVLLTGEALFGSEVPHASAVAGLVAARGVERYAAEDSWPSGAGASTPALMIGQAGVGHFYLRLARPATPSVLLIDVDAFVGADIHTTMLTRLADEPDRAVAVTG